MGYNIVADIIRLSSFI